MESDFLKLEYKILKFWNKDRIFEKSILQRKKSPNFIFYEGPPTANAKPGIHHVLSRVYKDIICRYKTMRGFKVERKAGWDTHGLPVELEIEKKLGLKSKKDIEKYGIARFNKKCKKSVWEYKKDWEKLTERIGFWLDMEHPYITYDPTYIETLWWIIKQIWQKGLLYQDYKVVPYCPRCGTSLSSHEVALGYKTVKEPAIYIKFQIPNYKLQTNSKFKIQNSKLYLLVWTTTPWTLPGNVAVAVHPELIYVAAKKNDEVLILAKERLDVLDEGYEILVEMKGKALLGLKYEPLFGVKSQNKTTSQNSIYNVIAGDFVSAKEGTGLVHIAPAFGEEDMEVIKIQNSKLKIKNLPETPILLTVDEDGKMRTPGYHWDGLFVKEADPLIIEDLKKRGLLFKEELYEHDYPFCWRCDSPLLYFVKQSWFINMQRVKKDLIANNQKINWFPPHLKEGRFGKWLQEIKDWAFSRERYWGTPLPIWQCQVGKNQKSRTKNQKFCNNLTVIGSVDDLLLQKSSHNRYFFARHGHSARQVKKIAMCWPEKGHFSLTREGRGQVLKMAKELKKEKIDFIFSSDLLRTKQTAQILAKETGAKLVYDKRLREYDVGIFNSRDPHEAWNFLYQKGDVIYHKLPKGESIAQLAKRMYRFLETLDNRYRNKNIVVVSHELPLTLLEGVLRGLSLEKIIELRRRGIFNRLGLGEWRRIEFHSLPFNEKMQLDFHRPYVDQVYFLCPKCGGKMIRVKDVIDVWFDSGAMPFAQNPRFWTQDKKLKIKDEKLRPPALFPADYISEAVDQTRGWFYTLLAVSTLLGFGPPYKNVISLGHVLDEKGEKMSKSKGNVVDPWQVIEKYGADAVRWYFFTVNQPGDAKLFSEKDIDLALKKFILTFWNSYLFWKTYSPQITNHKSQITNKIQNPKHKTQSILDGWILSRLNRLLEEVTQKLEAYDVTGAARVIENFVIEDLSLWYIRRSRKRFQHPSTQKELKEATNTLGFVLLQLAKLSAPFIPFLAEYIFTNFDGKKESIHLEDWPKADRKFIDSDLEEKMKWIREIVAKALALRVRAGIKVRQPLVSLRIPVNKRQIPKALLELIKEEVNVKQITFGKTLTLDTKITPELKEEGAIREVVRHIQELRKEANLIPKHRIIIFYSGDQDVIKIIEKYKSRILSETNAGKIIFEEPAQKTQLSKSVLFDKTALNIGIHKVAKTIKI